MKRVESRPTRRSNAIDLSGEATRGRLAVLIIILSVWVGAIGAKLIYLQVVSTDWYKTQALLRQRKTVVTDPTRGTIVDRQGRQLARTVEAPSFFILPYKIQDANKLSEQITGIIGGDTRALAERLQRSKDSKAKFAWIARKVDDTQAEKIRALAIDGMDCRNEPKRFYPNGVLASHVLGFVSSDNDGLAGIERSHNEDIRGEAGKVDVEHDASNKSYASTITSTNEAGTITLTIDTNMQFQVEQLLMKAVQSTGAKSATAVVEDPRTGEILAMANYPSFDPNYPTGSSAELRANSALQNVYEPGSTFKIVAYAAALQEHKVTPQEPIDCQYGAITVAGRLIKDSGKYGVLTATEALAKSSNVAAIKLGLKLGNQSMYDYSRAFGFGSKSGIELPGESIGILRKPARWSASSIGSIAIGQEISVTPLQITSAFATVANDGLRIAPHLVREVRDENGVITYRADPAQTRVISVETAQTLRHMLENVTVNGTAKRAQLDGYTAAGKTGTAQKADPKGGYTNKHIASFVGFAPVNNPAVVIAVVIDEPGGAYHGGDVAAPVFRDIAEQILPELNVNPDADAQPETAESVTRNDKNQTDSNQVTVENTNESLPRVVAPGKNREETVYVASANRAMLMPDLRGKSVRDVASICAQMGIQLEARGNGRAVNQFPVKGRKLALGQTVRVDFSRSD
ncbi:MAG: penicillin-binding protein [Pyrinomonadaceae bacterium]